MRVVGVIMMHLFGLIAATRLSAFWLPGLFSVGEYALVYRAGLSNEARPFELRLWDKSYDFAHRTPQILKPSAQTASEFHQNCRRPNWPMLMDNRRERLAEQSKGQSLT
jgi:hypothetical protein